MSSPELPTSPMSQPTASIPGLDPTPVINAGEQQLAGFLAMPTQQLLNQLGLPQVPSAAPTVPTNSELPANPGGPMTPFNPSELISPVVQALSTLGNGQFPGVDPTSMLNGISNTFNGTSGPLQQALGAAQQGWQGVSSTAAAAKTSAALANGTEVATQASGLQSSLSAAAADVAQAQTQLIAIIDQFNATVAAIGPNIVFPWGWAAVLTAASQAVTQTAQVMTQTQSSLAAQASAVSAIGSPVNVTSAPQLGTSGAGALGSLLGLGSSGSSAAGSAASPTSALSALSPLMYGASAGISPALSAATAAGRAGNNPAATDPATLADAKRDDPNAAAVGAALGGKSGAAAPVTHAGAGGGAALGTAPAPRIAVPTTPALEPGMLSAPTRPMAGGSMGGGGMMGAPLAGAGNAASAGGAHTAASFLHTSDHGGKVVGSRTTVAPPVIGEADPNDTPDIQLRI